MRSRGQALVELAVSLPVLVVLALGGATFVQIAITRAGIDAATAAAAGAAARAPNATAAGTAATAAFAGVANGYGLSSATLSLGLGDFPRGGTVTATGEVALNLGLSGTPTYRLDSRATARLEDWRSRTLGP